MVPEYPRRFDEGTESFVDSSSSGRARTPLRFMTERTDPSGGGPLTPSQHLNKTRSSGLNHEGSLHDTNSRFADRLR